VSIRVMADVWDFGPEDATECYILVCLANHCDDNGRSCFPSIARIAQMSRRSARTVVRVIAALEAGGWIAVERGVGRGVISQYTIHVAKLKRCQGVTFSEAEKVTLAQQKVTLTTEKGDIDDNPPHPPLGVTVKEPSGNPSAGMRQRRDADPRHAPFKAAIENYWDAKNPAVPMPWGASEAGALGQFLRDLPELELETFVGLLRGRFRSGVNHGDRPRAWIGSLTSYMRPLDRYKIPKGETDGTDRPSAQRRRVDDNLAALAKALKQQGYDGPGGDAGTADEALRASGHDGGDAGVRGGLREARGEVLAPEAGSRGRGTAHRSGASLFPEAG
jgi:hypothetical protein